MTQLSGGFVNRFPTAAHRSVAVMDPKACHGPTRVPSTHLRRGTPKTTAAAIAVVDPHVRRPAATTSS